MPILDASDPYQYHLVGATNMVRFGGLTGPGHSFFVAATASVAINLLRNYKDVLSP
jgi:hypothetical protein